MCSGSQLCSRSGRPPPGSSADSANNSGSQYALCALGVGLVALGIVMIVWSVVPSDAAGNSNSSKPGGQGGLESKGKTSTVAFVLVGAGVAMLFLSVCLGVRSKHRQQREGQAPEAQSSDRAAAGPEAETPADMDARYDVPTYEDAVGSGQYPVRQSNLRNSTSQLPSYEDLVDAVQHEDEGPAANATPEPAQPPPTPAGAAAPEPQSPPTDPPSRQNGLSRKLHPLKVRRIKSEKLHLKNIRDSAQAGPPSIEPLTPPPQYEDTMPEL